MEVFFLLILHTSHIFVQLILFLFPPPSPPRKWTEKSVILNINLVWPNVLNILLTRNVLAYNKLFFLYIRHIFAVEE